MCKCIQYVIYVRVYAYVYVRVYAYVYVSLPLVDVVGGGGWGGGGVGDGRVGR